jgi:hypothetical protein
MPSSSKFLIYRSIIEELKKMIGVEAFCAREVAWILENLSGHLTVGTINSHLKRTKTGIRPELLGINTKGKYNIIFYPQEVVWNFLKSLDKNGRISLAENGIKSFFDIIEKKFHEGEVFKAGFFTGDGRVKKGEPIDSCGRDGGDQSPSWDNAVRQHEE